MFQSTRPARGATALSMSWASSITSFNPRAPHGARRLCGCSRRAVSRFQSTRPARGATSPSLCRCTFGFVSIHAPRTGRDLVRMTFSLVRRCFNPRAPHGARPREVFAPTALSEFQSTRPARGATSYVPGPQQSTRVSIHAPRTGRDVKELRAHAYYYVSIHAPRTGRDSPANSLARSPPSFNPRAPHGARPPPSKARLVDTTVSIHAPRTGRDAYGVYM